MSRREGRVGRHGQRSLTRRAAATRCWLSFWSQPGHLQLAIFTQCCCADQRHCQKPHGEDARRLPDGCLQVHAPKECHVREAAARGLTHPHSFTHSHSHSHSPTLSLSLTHSHSTILIYVPTPGRQPLWSSPRGRRGRPAAEGVGAPACPHARTTHSLHTRTHATLASSSLSTVVVQRRRRGSRCGSESRTSCVRVLPASAAARRSAPCTRNAERGTRRG